MHRVVPQYEATGPKARKEYDAYVTEGDLKTYPHLTHQLTAAIVQPILGPGMPPAFAQVSFVFFHNDLDPIVMRSNPSPWQAR